jgi:ubiquinone/menaquinone biosynthesis C-methylase UbiE
VLLRRSEQMSRRQSLRAGSDIMRSKATSSASETSLGTERSTLGAVSEGHNLHDEVRSTWDELAAFWDERVEAGLTWQRHLIQPAVERLLRLQPGERVLEIACGNGDFARRMSELGGQVLAIDFSDRMLEQARVHGGDIDYRRTDAMDEAAILALGEPGSFDAVVCNMAIMDMESIEPMVAASSRLLTPAGRFVFSTLHPAFNSGNVRPMVELDMEGSLTETYSVRVSSYSRSSVGRGVAIPGQPVEQWYFHRPLSMILEPFFDHGFAVDGLEEPLVGTEHGKPGTPGFVYTQVPGVLIARLRRNI